MNKDLEDLIRISRAVGGDARLVQGGGGNTSVKTDDGRRMYVKASGTSLADMSEEKGYRLVDTARCLEMLRDEKLLEMPRVEREARVLERLLASCVDRGEGRPSVEASLHALLGRCVVHTHPSILNGLLCAVEAEEAIEELFCDLEPPYLYTPYTDPGYQLAVTMQHGVNAYRQHHGLMPEVIFLGNHGLFVSVQEPDRGLELTHLVCAKTESAWRARAQQSAPRTPLQWDDAEERARAVSEAMQGMYGKLHGQPTMVRLSTSPVVQEFLALPDAPHLVAVNPLMPDQVIYCKGMPLWLSLPEDVREAGPATERLIKAAAQGSQTPACVVADGLGLFSAAPGAKLLDAALAAMEATLQVLSVASCFGGPRGLSDEQVESIRNWEVAKFRHKLMSGG